MRATWSLYHSKKKEILKLCALIEGCYPNIKKPMKLSLSDFKLDGLSLFQIASQKHHISFYINKVLLKVHKEELMDLNLGKGCIRFKRLDPITPDILMSIIKGAEAYPFELSKRGNRSG